MAELSIIIPTYNDRATIEGCVAAVNEVVTHASLNVETLIVDDDSNDGSLSLAQELVQRFPTMHIRVLARKRHKYYGFGSLLRYGMAYATGRFCVLVSSDGHDPVELIPQFLARLRAGAQLVQCNRFVDAIAAKAIPLRFRTYQRIYRAVVRLLLGLNIRDTTYGFRGFDRVFVQALGTSSIRFNICPEMTFKVILAGGRIEYLPGVPSPGGGGGSSKFQLPNEILGYAYVVLRAALHRAGVLRWF